jgi:hypothetical protein
MAGITNLTKSVSGGLGKAVDRVGSGVGGLAKNVGSGVGGVAKSVGSGVGGVAKNVGGVAGGVAKSGVGFAVSGVTAGIKGFMSSGRGFREFLLKGPVVELAVAGGWPRARAHVRVVFAPCSSARSASMLCTAGRHLLTPRPPLVLPRPQSSSGEACSRAPADRDGRSNRAASIVAAGRRCLTGHKTPRASTNL